MQPLKLEEHRFSTSDAIRLSGVPEKSLRNWLASERRVLQIGVRHFTGRILFSVLDIFQIAALHDLTRRAGMAPSDAAGIASVVASEIRKRAPTGADGHLTIDLATIPGSLALSAARIDGEMMVGLIDPSQPEYLDYRGAHGRAHMVVPIAGLVADVLYRSMLK